MDVHFVCILVHKGTQFSGLEQFSGLFEVVKQNKTKQNIKNRLKLVFTLRALFPVDIKNTVSGLHSEYRLRLTLRSQHRLNATQS